MAAGAAEQARMSKCWRRAEHERTDLIIDFNADAEGALLRMSRID